MSNSNTPDSNNNPTTTSTVGKIDLSVSDNVYDVMQQRLVGYFMCKDEADQRHLAAGQLQKIQHEHEVQAERLRHSSKHHAAEPESIHVDWREYESGRLVLQSEVELPQGSGSGAQAGASAAAAAATGKPQT